MIAAQNTKRKIWSVVKRDGSYVAQVTEANSQAKLDGWQVVSTGLTVSEACEMRDSLKVSASVSTPDFSDLLVWDYTEEIEVRSQDAIEEYDTISVACTDGITRIGQALMWDDKMVLIEVGSTIYLGDKSTAELIAKIEDGDWMSEYEGWLDELFTDTEVSQTGAMVA